MLQNSDFSYLDPARGFDGGVNAFYRLVYRGLTMQTAGDADDPNEIVPDLATGLGEVSDDGLTWTYTLKDGIKFDNEIGRASCREREWSEGAARTRAQKAGDK